MTAATHILSTAHVPTPIACHLKYNSFDVGQNSSTNHLSVTT